MYLKMAVGGDKGIAVVPVHLELAVRVLMVVLIRIPAQFEHAVADLADDLVTPHQRRLVVAGLGLAIGDVPDVFSVRRDQEEFAFDAALQLEATFGGLGNQPLQDIARGLFDRLAAHPGVSGEPGDLWFPGKLDEALRIGNGKDIRIGWRHVEPCGEPGEARAVLGHAADRFCRNELGPLRAQQIRVGNKEVLDVSFFGDFSKID
jgi:hypothetical protein